MFKTEHNARGFFSKSYHDEIIQCEVCDMYSIIDAYKDGEMVANGGPDAVDKDGNKYFGICVCKHCVDDLGIEFE